MTTLLLITKIHISPPCVNWAACLPVLPRLDERLRLGHRLILIPG